MATQGPHPDSRGKDNRGRPRYVRVMFVLLSDALE